MDGSSSHGHPAPAPARRPSRPELRSRKLMMKSDLAPLPGISRIILKRAGMTFMVVQPEVYFNSRRNCYVVFGDLQPMSFPGMGDPDAAPSGPSKAPSGGAAASSAPAKGDAERKSKDNGKNKSSGKNNNNKGESETTQDTSAGLLESDIETVMREANVERERAVALLKEHGDTVEAILAAGE